MRICIIYQGEYPPAERIEKTAKSLGSAGHELLVLCNNYGAFSGGLESTQHSRVWRLRAYFRSRILNKIFNFPVFLNPRWVFGILFAVLRYRIEAIQVIDIPLAPAAWLIARVLGLPVIMDMWENYPEALKGWAKLDWKVRVFKNPAVARAIEIFITPRMDQIFVVVDEQRQRLIDNGASPQRVSVVTNGADIEMFSGGAAIQTPLDDEPETFKLLYVGSVTVERGLDEVIRAVALLRKEIPSLRLFIAGTGNYLGELKRISKETGVTDLVQFPGWVPFEQIKYYIEKSDLCLIPHVRSNFIDTTIPNKLFQYMLVGKPVLVSDAKPLARVVRESDCGFIFKSGDVNSAASAIRLAYAARSDNSRGERGRQAVLSKYTWDKVAENLVHHYQRLQRAGVAPRRASSAQIEL